MRNYLFLYLYFPIEHDNTINRGLGGTGEKYLALHSCPDDTTQRGAALDVVLTGAMESHLIENADWCYRMQKGDEDYPRLCFVICSVKKFTHARTCYRCEI